MFQGLTVFNLHYAYQGILLINDKINSVLNFELKRYNSLSFNYKFFVTYERAFNPYITYEEDQRADKNKGRLNRTEHVQMNSPKTSKIECPCI